MGSDRSVHVVSLLIQFELCREINDLDENKNKTFYVPNPF